LKSRTDPADKRTGHDTSREILLAPEVHTASDKNQGNLCTHKSQPHYYTKHSQIREKMIEFSSVVLPAYSPYCRKDTRNYINYLSVPQKQIIIQLVLRLFHSFH